MNMNNFILNVLQKMEQFLDCSKEEKSRKKVKNNNLVDDFVIMATFLFFPFTFFRQFRQRVVS
jgi:hypothetical protein